MMDPSIASNPLDPACPCVSGRRLSTCCGAASGGAFTDGEVGHVLLAVLRFGRRDEFAAALRRNRRGLIAELTPEQSRALFDSCEEEVSAGLVLLLTELPVRKGLTVASLMLRRYCEAARPRALLAQWAAQPLSLYEVVETFPGKGVVLRESLARVHHALAGAHRARRRGAGRVAADACACSRTACRCSNSRRCTSRRLRGRRSTDGCRGIPQRAAGTPRSASGRRGAVRHVAALHGSIADGAASARRRSHPQRGRAVQGGFRRGRPGRAAAGTRAVGAEPGRRRPVLELVRAVRRRHAAYAGAAVARADEAVVKTCSRELLAAVRPLLADVGLRFVAVEVEDPAIARGCWAECCAAPRGTATRGPRADPGEPTAPA